MKIPSSIWQNVATAVIFWSVCYVLTLWMTMDLCGYYDSSVDRDEFAKGFFVLAAILGTIFARVVFACCEKHFTDAPEEIESLLADLDSFRERVLAGTRSKSVVFLREDLEAGLAAKIERDNRHRLVFTLVVNKEKRRLAHELSWWAKKLTHSTWNVVVT